VLWLCGCGSNDENFVVGAAGAPASGAAVLGRLHLGGAIEGVPVQLQDSSGAVLGETTTSRTGTFAFRGLDALPQDFRVSARLSNGDQFATEVRGQNGANSYLAINLPTSLVAAVLQADPSLGFEQASEKVREYLGFQDVAAMAFSSGESARAPFSHLAFFVAAAENGGWTSFRDQIVSDILGGRPRPDFSLSHSSLDTPLAGLDPGLVAALERTRAEVGFPEMVAAAVAERAPAQLRRLAEGLVSEPAVTEVTAQSASDTTILGKIIGTIRHIGGSTSDADLQSIGWSHILDALNFNYGTTRMVEVNQDQLISLLRLITATASSNVNTPALQTRIDSMLSLANRLSNINGGGDGVGGTPTKINPAQGQDLQSPNSPKNPPGDVTSLTSDIVAFNDYISLLTDLNNVARGTSGPTSAILTYRNDFNTSIGTVGTFDTGYFPVTSSNLVSRALFSYNYYASLQMVTAILYAERSHVASANPTVDMTNAFYTLLDAANNLKLQRSQLPLQPLASDVMIDIQGGLMWSTLACDPDTIGNARTFADNFRVVGSNGHVYDDWRLPSEGELALLQDRGRLCTIQGAAPQSDPGVYPDTYNTLAGLVGLGWNTWNMSSVNDNGDLWCESWDYKNGSWSSTTGYYSINTDDSTLFGDRFQKDSSTSSKHAYFLVRNFGQPVVIEDSDAPSGSSPYTDYAALTNDEFTTTGWMSALRYTGFDRGTPGANSLWRMVTGGSIEMGVNGTGNSDSRQFPRIQLEVALDTYYDALDPVNPHDIITMISGVPNLLTIGGDGQMYYHNDVADRNPTPVAFNAQSINRAGQNVGEPSGVPVPLLAPLTVVRDIAITPRNRVYNLNGAASGTDNYACLAYMSDNTVRDVSGSAVWTVTRSNGQPSTSSSFQGSQLRYNNSGAETIQVKATYQGFTDTCAGQVNP
jgi:hypothetical protein